MNIRQLFKENSEEDQKDENQEETEEGGEDVSNQEKYRDKNYLIDQYKAGKTPNELAKKHGVSVQTIYKYNSENDILGWSVALNAIFLCSSTCSSPITLSESSGNLASKNSSTASSSK